MSYEGVRGLGSCIWLLRKVCGRNYEIIASWIDTLSLIPHTLSPRRFGPGQPTLGLDHRDGEPVFPCIRDSVAYPLEVLYCLYALTAWFASLAAQHPRA